MEGDMEKEIIEIPGLSDAIRNVGVPLSICVKAGDLLFVSGLPPLDADAGKMVEGGVAAQTEQVLKNIKHTLETAGSSLDRVVKCTIYITNAAYFGTVNEIYGRYFPNDPPARTFVAMASWPMEFDIEIECVALA
jgi:reactive intermediate/imine deaminase